MNYRLRAAEAAHPAYKLYYVFRFSHVTTLNRLVFDKLASISTRKPENLARYSGRSLGNSSNRAYLSSPFDLYSFSPASLVEMLIPFAAVPQNVAVHQYSDPDQ